MTSSLSLISLKRLISLTGFGPGKSLGSLLILLAGIGSCFGQGRDSVLSGAKMKPTLRIVICLLVLTQVGALGQQAETRANSESRPAGTASLPPDKDKMSEEERLIRSAYEKLMRYHKASVLYEFEGKDEDLPAESLLEFELKNFKTGPIDEVKDQFITDFVPLATGEILDFDIGRRTMNRIHGPFC